MDVSVQERDRLLLEKNGLKRKRQSPILRLKKTLVNISGKKDQRFKYKAPASRLPSNFTCRYRGI